MTKRLSQNSGNASRPFIETKKRHAADKMTMKIDKVAEIDDLIRAGEYQAALEKTEEYGFAPTKELLRAIK